MKSLGLSVSESRLAAFNQSGNSLRGVDHYDPYFIACHPKMIQSTCVCHKSPTHPMMPTVPSPTLVVIDALQVAAGLAPSRRYLACPAKPERWHRWKLPWKFLYTISSTRSQTSSIPDPPYLDETTNANRSRQRHLSTNLSCRTLRENRESTNHHSQFIPYPSGYMAPKPVPLKWYPAPNPLVLNFHVWLLWNNPSENRSAVSPSSGFIRSRRPRRWRSIPFPVAASRVSRVCVCTALFKSSNLRFDYTTEMVS